MKFVVLIEGNILSDYYEAQRFEEFEMATIDQGIEKCKELIEFYGKDTISSVRLVEMGLTFNIDLSTLKTTLKI